MRRPVGPAAIWAAGLFCAALLTGCGSSTGEPPSLSGDAKEVARLLSAVNDDRANPKRLTARFAQGAVPAPAELKRYAQYGFYLGGKPAVKGDTATLTVRVDDERAAKQVGTQEWAFVKEGAAWKLKSAPLP